MKKAVSTSGASARPPQLYEAVLGSRGAVIRGRVITQQEAETLRKAGRDIVVCGNELRANRRLADLIERNANGTSKRSPPHDSAGPLALPHCQPDPRPPEGHTFYETPNRKAVTAG